MTRRKPVPSVNESLPPAVEDVARLTEQVSRLWQALDTIRAELHAVLDARPARQELPSPFRLTSMALDPCDPAWNQKTNAIRPEDLPPELRPMPLHVAREADDKPAPETLKQIAQAPTKDIEHPIASQEEAEQIFYCCAEPQLAWAGDPDEPSVLCLKCGYIVAEYGTVLDEREAWRAGTASFESGPPTKREAQGELFEADE